MKWMSLLFLAMVISAVPLSAYQRCYVMAPEMREMVVVPQVQEVVYVRERVAPQQVVVVMPQPQPRVCYVPCRPQPQVSFSIGGGSSPCHRSNLWWNVNWSGPSCCY